MQHKKCIFDALREMDPSRVLLDARRSSIVVTVQGTEIKENGRKFIFCFLLSYPQKGMTAVVEEDVVVVVLGFLDSQTRLGWGFLYNDDDIRKNT